MYMLELDPQNNPVAEQHSPEPVVRPEIVIIEPEPQTGRHRAEARSWLGLADRVLHSWPITLRLALLLLIVLAGVAGAAAALGVFGR